VKAMFAAVVLLLVVAACGDGTGGNRTGGDDPFAVGDSTAETTSAPVATTVATATTSPATTTTMATTTTQSGEFVVYDDPGNDCLNAETNAPAPTCMPEATDLLRIELTRASPLTVLIEIADPGEPGLGHDYHFTLGLDLDQDASTGIVDGWPEWHGMAPDLESDYFGSSDSDEFFVQAYAIEGQNGFVLLDPPPVVWTWVDDTHIQAVFEMEAVGDGSFGIVGELITGHYKDHFVDHGHLLFPSGDVVLNP